MHLLNLPFAVFDPGKDQAKDVALLLVGFFVITALLFGAAVAGQINGAAKPWHKYIAVIPPLFAGVAGWKYYQFATDSFTRIAYSLAGSPHEKAYIAMPFLSFLMAIGVVVIGKIIDRSLKARSHES